MVNDEYENYHKHDRISNIFTPDTHIFTIDYINRIKELGYGCYFTTNHGSGGDIFEALTLCRQNGIKCLFGIEGYIVPNPLEKDKRNYHIVIIPRDNVARKKLNLINSRANAEGFYYKPRIFLEDLLKLNPNEVFITTACVAGIVRDIDGVRDIFMPLMQHFGKNLFLEVQNHNERNQKLVNQICLKLSDKYGLNLIAANDSHYIYPEQSKDRLEFLKGKGINYGDEDSYLLDFPDYDTFYQRFIKQGVLSPEQIKTAIANTLIFRDCEEINVDYSIKMPSIFPTYSADEKITELKAHTVSKFKDIIKSDEITKDELPKYKQGIYDEMDVIEQTKEINTADYFLFNEKLVDKAVNEYHGVLTRTGRGSCGSFYINKILGMTQLDRFRLDIKLYPERFMSTARLLENRALPDIDFNVVSQEPFVKAAKDLLGEHGCYPMIAYGTMQLGEAFRNVCRTHDVPYDEYNEIAKKVEDYAETKKWKPYINEAKKYIDVVVSASPHPCFDGNELVLTNNGYLPIQEVKVGDKVLSDDNKYHKVLRTMITPNKNLYELKIQGRPPVLVTDNHPILSRHLTSHTGSYKRLSDPRWKQANELVKDDFVCININSNAIIPSIDNIPVENPFFWWIVGRFVGDGWLTYRKNPNRKDNVINICCAKNETNEITNVLDVLGVYNYWISEDKTVNKIHICNKYLYKFLQNFGRGAKNKYIPQFVIDLPKSLLINVINGYISADGYHQFYSNSANHRYAFTTISKKLALSMSDCIHKVFNVYCSISVQDRKDNYIDGRLLKGNRQYIGKYSFNPSNKRYIIENDKIWVRFSKLKNTSQITNVYNLEVEQSHTYTINNIIVHNCAYLLDNKDLRSEYGVVRVGDKLCVMITSSEADEYKMLKDDFLVVTVYKLIDETFKLINKPIITVRELLSSIENDDRIWDIFAKGLTCTLNQVDGDWATSLLKEYKPKTVSDMAMFVACLRPFFNAWRDGFIAREDFTTGSSYLDEVLSSTNGYILFQENLMQYFEWLGVTPAESIGLIKKISKKKIKPEDFQKLEERIRVKWLENTGSMKAFDTTWEMIQGCMSYGFCSAHAVATAIDCLYGAYLKVNYPLEYYTVALTNYSGDMERTNKLMNELSYFGITLHPIKFGKSSSQYTMDKKNNAIYKGIESIKFCNATIADELLELSHNHYESFIALLDDITSKTTVNSRQLKILTGLNFFSEFGENQYLLTIINLYNGIKVLPEGAKSPKTILPSIRNIKQFKKDKLEIYREYGITENLIKKYSEKETAKQYSQVDNLGLLIEVCKSIPNKPMSVKDYVHFEKENLDYVTYQNSEMSDDYYIVTDFTVYKDTTKPNLVLRKLKTGEDIVTRIKQGKIYKQNPFGCYDILRIQGFTWDYKKRSVNGEWKTTDELEPILEEYEVM